MFEAQPFSEYIEFLRSQKYIYQSLDVFHVHQTPKKKTKIRISTVLLYQFQYCIDNILIWRWIYPHAPSIRESLSKKFNDSWKNPFGSVRPWISQLDMKVIRVFSVILIFIEFYLSDIHTSYFISRN